METFAVVAVIDGNTLDVSPGWELENRTGNRVQATGYNAPKTGKGAMAAEQKLSILIQNKKVELGSPRGIERGRLVCEVYFQGRNLADYLPEYKEQESEAPDKLED
ncbi:MAG: thermonuclease family protein [Dehalococcoidia bacterium]|nr:thermonuclease family protein [Dehalococcoidia bacterium]